jgi:hypothetical protein
VLNTVNVLTTPILKLNTSVMLSGSWSNVPRFCYWPVDMIKLSDNKLAK